MVKVVVYWVSSDWSSCQTSGKSLINGTKYSTMDQVNFFKSCLPQILLRPVLNTLSQMIVQELKSYPESFAIKTCLAS